MPALWYHLRDNHDDYDNDVSNVQLNSKMQTNILRMETPAQQVVSETKLRLIKCFPIFPSGKDMQLPYR